MGIGPFQSRIGCFCVKRVLLVTSPSSELLCGGDAETRTSPYCVLPIQCGLDLRCTATATQSIAMESIDITGTQLVL